MRGARLVVSESLRSLGANLSTTIAATMTVLIGMLLLGLFIALGTWVVSWSHHAKNQLEVKVFFVDGVDEKQSTRSETGSTGDPLVEYRSRGMRSSRSLDA